MRGMHEDCGCGRERGWGPPPWARAHHVGYGFDPRCAGPMGPEGPHGHAGRGHHGAHHGGGEVCGHGHGRHRGGMRGGRLGMLEPAVLAALAGGKAHGYDLRRAIDEMTGGRVFADPGGIYRVLRRLEEDGLVRSEWSEGDFGPQKRNYELTDDGRALLADWAEELKDRIAQLSAIADAATKAATGPQEEPKA